MTSLGASDMDLDSSASLFELLDGESLSLILGLLSPKECCVLACVCSALREFVSGHQMWPKLLLERYGQEEVIAPSSCPTDPSETLLSFKEAFIAWEIRFGGYDAFFARGWSCWSTLEAWTRTHFEPVYQSLAGGASEEQLDEAEQSLGVTFPRAMRMMYRVHDGQDLSFDRAANQIDASMFHGLFGGYCFYNHLVCVRLLPLKVIVDITSLLRQHESTRHLTSNAKVVIAACKSLRKLFVLDTANGNVYAACMNRKLLQASPSSCENGDGLLGWMEAYAANLAAGKYSVERLIEEEDLEEDFSRAIALYPRRGQGTSVAITKGIKVEAGVLLIPERSNPPEMFFSYSIRFSLLPVDEQRAADESAEPLTSTQLLARHWVITDGDNSTDEVRGEAVVGEYPLLTPGQEPFVYQSCTSMAAEPGRMEGDFTFVTGTIAEPTGGTIKALCAPFALAVPEAVF
uniref:ApaG domain-containing protein n=1 Tax=Pyramimonas obovata TaxID=1411642 RepID=A0A7S0RC94_9CHLO|mmetsp:Transcript_30670/g.66961  ORF Transcript_30670/g.66961 Transcript_30670/m.66961 type:complete len:460 (+) Transcript_30670:172-1551(+)